MIDPNDRPRPESGGSDDPTLPPSPVPRPGSQTTSTQPPQPAELSSDLPEVFGPYRIEKLLGRGGMGAVYRARDTRLGRTVAVKVPFLSGPHADAVRGRFLREARAAAALHHPNVCPIFEVGDVGGVPYLTMPLITGEPLSRRLDAGAPFEPGAAVALVRTLALALQEAHDRGIIHRDLKPGNVMIDGRDQPIVMDFGLARGADAGLEQLTRDGEVVGTPAYMPPEQINGDVKAVGPASDVYSLGVLLYELLAGRLPFQGDLLALVMQINEEQPTPPSRLRPGLDRRLDEVCLRALAKKPAERWPSMRHFADALLGPLAPFPPRLGLRIVGTPFVYRPAPGQRAVTLGRQKRKPGDPPEQGNDVVLRIPGNDALSARISRRHLEIHLEPHGLRVIDHSKGGTLHNGRPLTRDEPAPLAIGDRLVVAGVLALEVCAPGATHASTSVTEIEAPAQGSAMAPVFLEATLGDLATID